MGLPPEGLNGQFVGHGGFNWAVSWDLTVIMKLSTLYSTLCHDLMLTTAMENITQNHKRPLLDHAGPISEPIGVHSQ